MSQGCWIWSVSTTFSVVFSHSRFPAMSRSQCKEDLKRVTGMLSPATISGLIHEVLLVVASVVLLRSSCHLLGYSALNKILLSVYCYCLAVHLLMVKTVSTLVAPVWSSVVESISPILVSILMVVVRTRLLPLALIIKRASIFWLLLVGVVSDVIVLWSLIPVPNCFLHFVDAASHLSYEVKSDGSHCICPQGTLFWIGRSRIRELLNS